MIVKHPKKNQNKKNKTGEQNQNLISLLLNTGDEISIFYFIAGRFSD